MKVIAYIEYSMDGMFSVYTTEYGFYGYGDTEEEARKDFIDAYNEFFDMGWCKDVLKFEFKRIEQ